MSEAFRVVWDSGASICVSNCKEDFIERLHAPPTSITSGIDGPINVEGCGHVSWTFKTCNHEFRTVILHAVYIPSAPHRLLSIGSLLRQYPTELITMKADGIYLSGNQDSNAPTNPIAILSDPHNHLPTAFAYRQDKENKSSSASLIVNFEESATEDEIWTGIPNPAVAPAKPKDDSEITVSPQPLEEQRNQVPVLESPSTSNICANAMNKGQARELFEHNRKLINDWLLASFKWLTH